MSKSIGLSPKRSEVVVEDYSNNLQYNHKKALFDQQASKINKRKLQDRRQVSTYKMIEPDTDEEASTEVF